MQYKTKQHVCKMYDAENIFPGIQSAWKYNWAIISYLFFCLYFVCEQYFIGFLWLIRFERNRCQWAGDSWRTGYWKFWGKRDCFIAVPFSSTFVFFLCSTDGTWQHAGDIGRVSVLQLIGCGFDSWPRMDGLSTEVFGS